MKLAEEVNKVLSKVLEKEIGGTDRSLLTVVLTRGDEEAESSNNLEYVIRQNLKDDIVVNRVDTDISGNKTTSVYDIQHTRGHDVVGMLKKELEVRGYPLASVSMTAKT